MFQYFHRSLTPHRYQLIWDLLDHLMPYPDLEMRKLVGVFRSFVVFPRWSCGAPLRLQVWCRMDFQTRKIWKICQIKNHKNSYCTQFKYRQLPRKCALNVFNLKRPTIFSLSCFSLARTVMFKLWQIYLHCLNPSSSGKLALKAFFFAFEKYQVKL